MFVQSSAISLFNTYQYKIRHGGEYKEFREYYAKVEGFNASQLDKEIKKKQKSFFKYVKRKSAWYNKLNIKDLTKNIPLEKQDIINDFDRIKTIKEKNGIVSLTGGTTGASMKVVYTKKDMQERFAILDHFRAQHGYHLGKKTAWFSGKNLISEHDIQNNICSHYDFINKIRFYSTFHINQDSFHVYWQSLVKFQPEFIVGFPSSVYELCEIADSLGLQLPTPVKVFFPTAETVLPKHREVIGRVLGCQLVDQYASSEGAPFILECTHGRLHIHPLTGIFEVVDENQQPAQSGELLVTSYTTHGTPLIRYRIGDHISLADPQDICNCGSIFSLVHRIEGRTSDYILSPTHGKVNLGNISNSTKNIEGIIKFQVIQNELKTLQVLVVCSDKFNQQQKENFRASLVERFGDNMTIDIVVVDDIATEKSGKFRIVKNLLDS